MLLSNILSGVLCGITLASLFAMSTAGGESHAWDGGEWETWLKNVNRQDNAVLTDRYIVCVCIIVASAFLFV